MVKYNFKHSKKLESLCNRCREYLDNLPSYERDIRWAALMVWCIALECEEYTKLPIFWRHSVENFLMGLQERRWKERSEEVTELSLALLEHLKDKVGYNLYNQSYEDMPFDFQQCYDCLWTVWNNI